MSNFDEQQYDLDYLEAVTMSIYVKKLLVNFLSLVPYLFSYFVPRRRDIWIFGAWYGYRFSDNSRYLFEYTNKNHPDIRSVWLSREKHLINEVRSLGYEAYLTNSWKGFWLSCRSGLVIVSNGVDDVNSLAISRAKKLQLWHGIPLKKIGMDSMIENPKRGITQQIAERLRYFLFPFRRNFKLWSAIIATSPVVRERMATAFGVDPSRVWITGYPRNDMFYDFRHEGMLAPLASMNAMRACRSICYAPTFRSGNKTDDLFENLDVGRLEECLIHHNAVLYVKMHYADSHILKAFPRPSAETRIYWISENDSVELNRILPFIDVLITDYSGAFIDFLLLDRPIIFAPFDLETYLTEERELYEEYDLATPGPKCASWCEVIHELDCFLDGDDAYAVARQEAKLKYHSYIDGNSCRRVFQVASKLVS